MKQLAMVFMAVGLIASPAITTAADPVTQPATQAKPASPAMDKLLDAIAALTKAQEAALAKRGLMDEYNKLSADVAAAREAAKKLAAGQHTDEQSKAASDAITLADSKLTALLDRVEDNPQVQEAVKQLESAAAALRKEEQKPK